MTLAKKKKKKKRRNVAVKKFMIFHSIKSRKYKILKLIQELFNTLYDFNKYFVNASNVSKYMY